MKKILALALCLVLALSFAGCGCDSTDATDATEATGAVEEEVKTVGGGKVLKMVTNAAFPPYEYKEGDAIVGIDAEIAAAIAEELGMELEIVDMEFDSIITAVVQDAVDFGMAGMTVTDERKENVDFTYSYATGVQVVIVTEGSPIATLDDLAGKKIGTQIGTTGFMYAQGDYGEENVIGYSKGADAVLALKGGDVDAVIIDNEPAKAFVAANTGLVILDTEYAVEDYAIAVAKDNTALLNAINDALNTLTADGTIDAIVAKYISAE